MSGDRTDSEDWAVAVRAFPVKGVPAEVGDLALPRVKSRSIVISAAYRVMAFARRIFGVGRMLRFSLNAAWLFRQFAYQLSYMAIGQSFLNATHGISDDLLKRWIPADASVIDIGCGYGRLCRLAAPYARRVVGIDYDARRIDMARRHTAAPQVEYRVADTTEGFGSEVFDVAILSHVIEHIDDVARLLSQLRAVARLAIVEVPDFDADPLNAVRRDLGCRWYMDNDHAREYTLPLLRADLGRGGLAVVEAERKGGMLVVIAAQVA